MSKPSALAVAMVGIPASGKSAIALSLSARLGIERISADDLIPRDEHGKRIYKPHLLRKAWLRVWRKVGRCIKENRSFVLDAMLLTHERRGPVIGMASGAGIATVGVFVNTATEICLIRNSLRKDRIADGRLLRAAASLEAPDPDEGWTALYRVDQNLSMTRWIRDHPTRAQAMTIPECFEPALEASVESTQESLRC